MREKLNFIFIYKEKIYNYEYEANLAVSSRYANYFCLSKIANYRLNMFLRDINIEDDLQIDFIMSINRIPYFMYVKKISNGEIVNYEIDPIISIIKNNNFLYDNIFITNTYRCNNIKISDDYTEIKIIDDGINEFNETHINLLENLPYSIEKVYLFYEIKLPVNNLPFTTKKVYTLENTDENLIKLPFNCKLIKIKI